MGFNQWFVKRVFGPRQSRIAWKYHGPPIGQKTSGDYGDLPRPMPHHYSFTQGPIDGFWMACFVATVGGVSAFVLGPFWMVPLWKPHRKYIEKAAEEFGPERYGVGKVFF